MNSVSQLRTAFGSELIGGDNPWESERMSHRADGEMPRVATLAIQLAVCVGLFSVGHYVGQNGSKAGVSPLHILRSIKTAQHISHSVERRRSPLPANCYPQVDAANMAENARSLTLVRTRIQQLSDDQQFGLFIHPLVIDQVATQELMLHGFNHQSTTAMLASLVPLLGGTGRSTLVYDIGANIGYVSLLSARLGAQVVAFEPTAYHRELLKTSMAINGIRETSASGSVHVVGAALVKDIQSSPKEVCLGMEQQLANAGATTLDIQQASCPKELRAPVMQLDAEIRKHGPPHIVKIDVEGYEMEALRAVACMSSRVHHLQRLSMNTAFIYEYSVYL